MKKSINFLAAIALLFCVSSCDSLHEPVADLSKPVFFADVKAIFRANGNQCGICHDGTTTGGKVLNANNKHVNIDVYADVKLWANTTDYKNSHLYLAVNPSVKGSISDMTSSTGITKDQIAIINKWLADGALEK